MKTFVLLILFGFAACSSTSVTPGGAGRAVVDCLAADRGQIDALEKTLTPLVFGAAPDWSALYQKAKDAGKVIGGCVISELVQSYLGGKKATPVDESWKGRGALERFRSEVAGGATFRTKAGDL